MANRLFVWSVVVLASTGCASTHGQSTETANDWAAKLKGAAREVREFVSPGSEAFERGQRYMAEKQLRRASEAFSEAARRAPNNQEYAKALKAARSEVVTDGLARVDALPEHALPEKIQLLDTVAVFDDGSVVSSNKNGLQRRLAELLETAARAKNLAPSDPAAALDAIVPVLKYAPTILEVAEVKSALVAQRASLLALAQENQRVGELEAAARRIDQLVEIFDSDDELVRLRRDITTAIEARAAAHRRNEVQRLTILGQQAKAVGALAIAAEYYARSNAIPQTDFPPIEMAPLEAQLKAARPLRCLLFSDSIPKEYRTRLSELVRDALAADGLPLQIEEFSATASSNVQFIVEVQLVDFQWNFDMGEPETVWSTFLAGYQKLSNPAYHQALADYQKALQDNAVTRATAYGVFGAIAIILSDVIVNRAREALNSTPLYLDDPIYQNYSYLKRVTREHGRLALRVTLIDLPLKQRYAAEDIVVTHEQTVIEIAGAHPADKSSVTNLSYSSRASQDGQDNLRTKALKMAAAKVTTFSVEAERHRGDDLQMMGGVLEGVEARLRYGRFLREGVGSRSAEGIRVTAELWSNHLDRGIPKGGMDLVEAVRSTRVLPSDSLLAKRLASATSIVSAGSTLTPRRVAMSSEEIVKRVAPSVVTVKTFTSQGSGFFVEQHGVLVTNAHVVSGARDVVVILVDGSQYMADIALRDEHRDVAVLKIEGNGFPELVLRTSDAPAVGEPVLAVGAPLGLHSSVTQGIVSSVRRAGDMAKGTSLDRDLNLVQTDAAINSGNSGGPLVDKFGLVVGMNSFKRRGSEGVGFAISAVELRQVLDSLPLENKAEHLGSR